MNTYDVNELRAELVLTSKTSSDEHYEQLLEQKEEIESELGEQLIWFSKEDVIMKKILLRRDADLSDENKWPEYFNWYEEKLNRFTSIFRERIKNIS